MQTGWERVRGTFLGQGDRQQSNVYCWVGAVQSVLNLPLNSSARGRPGRRGTERTSGGRRCERGDGTGRHGSEGKQGGGRSREVSARLVNVVCGPTAGELTSVGVSLELADGGLGLLDGGELDHSSSLAPAALEQDLGFDHLACRLEELNQVLVRGRPRQLWSHVDAWSAGDRGVAAEAANADARLTLRTKIWVLGATAGA